MASDTNTGPHPREIRAIAVREANVYWGWVAHVEKTVDIGMRDANVRLSQVLEVAEHIERYIITGERPNA